MGLTNPENNLPEDHARRVREMFAQISPRYDLLNHLLSANIDRKWRKAVARKLQQLLPPGSTVLDVACGTGDLSIELFASANVQVIGADFCRPMLEIAARKAPRICFVEADALRLPFPDASFTGVTIAFGLRNLASVESGLRELRRVLKPEGWLAILEFSRPQRPGFRALVEAYSQKLLPRIGGWISGSRSAYTYLPDSVSRFPDQARLAAMMRAESFANVAFEDLTGGVAALHIGQRPA
jgi:demethylmenaquinone methyltransferase/2-methoxy-6-polyprenyl-1,4-benzoquinol methylase